MRFKGFVYLKKAKFKKQNVGYIQLICATKGLRLGTLLMKEAESIINTRWGFNRILLHSVPEAKEFYIKKGFDYVLKKSGAHKKVNRMSVMTKII